ncbi:MAG: TRAP transporter large permease subunit [Treponema sp.]|nr:TRAP transporter large permease subunit [Treponema sp.]
MIRKIENAIAVGCVALLAVIPFIFKFLQGACHIQVSGADSAVIHFVFLFACFAGIITWREERHLSLASLTSKLPQKIQMPVEAVKTAVTACILMALFVNALCQLVNPAQFATSFWGISTRIFFMFLPVCYAAIIVMLGAKKKHLVATLCGIVLGLLVAIGPLTGILYYMFGVADVPRLYAFNDAWISLSYTFKLPFLVIFVLLAFLGVPLFLVLAGIAYVLFSQSGGYVDVIPLETYRILTDRNIAAIPLFTIAGYILAQSSAGRRYVAVFKALFGPFRGGTVIAAVIVTTFFSTFTGVSGVTILALGSLLSVVLVGSGYSQDNAESLVTASGAIGLLFPPSAAIIMYATVNYFSISNVFDLFKAALIPGVVMALAVMATGFALDKAVARPKFSWREVGQAARHCIPELLMPVCICMFYFGGFFDLFEVAAFAVVYAFCLSTFVRRDFALKKSAEVVADSVPVSGGVLFILGAASGISYFMLDADVPALLTEYITQYVTNPYVFLILMNLVLLIVGCLMDMFSAILIVSPLLLPLAESFGVSAVRAAVIFLMNLSIGFLTPPVGMDLFISSYTFNKPLSRVIKGIVPFLIVQLAVLMLITYVPFFTEVLL